MQPSKMLKNYEVIDNQITDEGDIVHFALYAYVEPVSFEEALKKSSGSDPSWMGSDFSALDSNKMICCRGAFMRIK